ncbi:Ribosomal protein L11 methyltransferase [Planctomycetes bacterium Poly30]|uniref:Ribosomal protein L11 methyltransferase n=1 Tax=Saltatorellus ferox TaxID=2528018 RepID=A0A518EMB9_9BACT|nr:Ribosomal protein L11 methyltransferase [Planctomycetes bacterium Poly30]
MTKELRSKMGWTEVRVDVPQGWQELVAETLNFGPCTTVAFGTTSIAARQPEEGHDAVRTFVMAQDDTPSFRQRVQVKLDELVELIGVEELTGLRADFKPLPPEDYATSWRKDWKPFRVGRLVLLPPWREEGPPRESDIRFTIQPAGSFGSGRHASTRTCLRVIDQRIRGGERVLDAGTGSGILSVAATLLGAESAVGFDIDPVSKPTADELAEDNGVAARCDFRPGDFSALREDEIGFDVVLANIYADVLQAHAAEFHRRLAPTGWFAFSGCRFDHRDATVAKMNEVGLRIDEERQRGRWVTFVGARA